MEADAEMDAGNEHIDDCLILVQQMFSEGIITEDQRETLKGK